MGEKNKNFKMRLSAALQVKVHKYHKDTVVHHLTNKQVCLFSFFSDFTRTLLTTQTNKQTLSAGGAREVVEWGVLSVL